MNCRRFTEILLKGFLKLDLLSVDTQGAGVRAVRIITIERTDPKLNCHAIKSFFHRNSQGPRKRCGCWKGKFRPGTERPACRRYKFRYAEPEDRPHCQSYRTSIKDASSMRS